MLQPMIERRTMQRTHVDSRDVSDDLEVRMALAQHHNSVTVYRRFLNV